MKARHEPRDRQRLGAYVQQAVELNAKELRVDAERRRPVLDGVVREDDRCQRRAARASSIAAKYPSRCASSLHSRRQACSPCSRAQPERGARSQALHRLHELVLGPVREPAAGVARRPPEERRDRGDHRRALRERLEPMRPNVS